MRRRRAGGALAEARRPAAGCADCRGAGRPAGSELMFGVFLAGVGLKFFWMAELRNPNVWTRRPEPGGEGIEHIRNKQISWQKGGRNASRGPASTLKFANDPFRWASLCEAQVRPFCFICI